MVGFSLLFVFKARTFLPGLGGLRKPCFPLEEAQFLCSIQGLQHPYSALRLSQQSSRPVGLGCAIFCSRVMSPWLTIMAHSVLLFSPDPLNGSLAFNKTCIVCSKVCFNPFLSVFLYVSLSVLTSVFLDEFGLCFSSEII